MWKFNTSLLSDQAYVKKIKQIILKIKKQYAIPVYNPENLDKIQNEHIQFSISDQAFLEVLLMEIRGQSISYASYVKKQKQLREKKLIKEIITLEQTNKLTEDILEHIDLKNLELEILRKEKIKGNMIRSRVQFIEEGEKPSNYFCNLENHNFVNKTITKLVK